MGSYLDNIFTDNIANTDVKTIFELGSRDLEDAIRLFNHYGCKVFAFECNPDCINVCKNKLKSQSGRLLENVILVESAVSLDNSETSFYPFDLAKYDNMGASSMFKIDFSKRDSSDPDYNRENPQKEITVKGERLDSFMDENGIAAIDLLCIDLQGYEINALKSLGDKLKTVKYIITECSIQSTYVGGATFNELNSFLSDNNFCYVASNRFGNELPDLSLKGFSEFDALFINISLI